MSTALNGRRGSPRNRICLSQGTPRTVVSDELRPKGSAKSRRTHEGRVDDADQPPLGRSFAGDRRQIVDGLARAPESGRESRAPTKSKGQSFDQPTQLSQTPECPTTASFSSALEKYRPRIRYQGSAAGSYPKLFVRLRAHLGWLLSSARSIWSDHSVHARRRTTGACPPGGQRLCGLGRPGSRA
jgi:hypothetical protein